MLSVGAGLDIVEREVGPDEAGPISERHDAGPVVAMIRDAKILRFDDARCEVLQRGRQGDRPAQPPDRRLGEAIGGSPPRRDSIAP